MRNELKEIRKSVSSSKAELAKHKDQLKNIFTAKNKDGWQMPISYYVERTLEDLEQSLKCLSLIIEHLPRERRQRKKKVC